AEIKLASLTSEYERLIAEGANSSDSTQEIEQEIQSQESALHDVESVLRATVADKEASVVTATAQRDAAKKAEATVNSLKEKLSAARARVEVLEQSLQPASGSSLAAIQNYQPVDVSEVLNIEPGWETAIAALLAGSMDRAWLESLASGVVSIG